VPCVAIINNSFQQIVIFHGEMHEQDLCVTAENLLNMANIPHKLPIHLCKLKHGDAQIGRRRHGLTPCP